MILNLGAERIMLITQYETFVIPFEQVEEQVTTKMIELYRELQPQKLFVVNGPGSFTNLRVGALVANLMAMLSKGLLVLETVSKLELFRYGYLQGLLPAHGYIYFGQRKNFWLSDMESSHRSAQSYQIFAQDPQIQDGYFVDRFVGDDFPIFGSYAEHLQLIYEDQKVYLSYQGEQLDCTHIFVPTNSIDPEYGVEFAMG